MTIAGKQAELLGELAPFHDWQERHEYVIGLGRKPAAMPAESKTADKLIKGRQSQVWLAATHDHGIVRYSANSDSLVTKGMIALFVRVLDGQSPDDILTVNMSFIDRTGLKEHLAPTRANELLLMATQMISGRSGSHQPGPGTAALAAAHCRACPTGGPVRQPTHPQPRPPRPPGGPQTPGPGMADLLDMAEVPSDDMAAFMPERRCPALTSFRPSWPLP